MKDLQDIEDVLREMWLADEAKVEEGAAADRPIIRVCLGNVVVVADENRAGDLIEILDRLSVRRPSRVLVAELGGGPEERGIEASIRAVCHLPAPGLPQVCCENIHLRFHPKSIELLPGVILPLLEPDVPSLVWWTRDLADHSEVFLKLVRVVGGLFFDLEQGRDFRALRGLLPELGSIQIHDYSWARIEPWRRALAQAFDDPVATPLLKEMREVVLRVFFAGDQGPGRGEAPVTALLLLGWLTAQLGWKVLAPFDLAHGWLRAVVAGPGRQIEIRIEPAGDDGQTERTCGSLDGVRILGADESEIHLERLADSRMIVCSIGSAHFCPLRRRVSGNASTPEEVIGAVLESSAHGDPIYRKALDRALTLAGE